MSLITIFFVLIIPTNSFAQSLGIDAGLNLSKMHVEDEIDIMDDEELMKIQPGFHFGPSIALKISKILSLETGILFSTKGYRLSEEETLTDGVYKYIDKVNLYYLNIPLSANIIFDLGGIGIYGTFGPYLGFGLTGKEKMEEEFDNEVNTFERDIEFGSNDDQLRRLDYGLNFGGGIVIKSIRIGGSYDFGLANISPNDNMSFQNRIIKISFGYRFGM